MRCPTALMWQLMACRHAKFQLHNSFTHRLVGLILRMFSALQFNASGDIHP